MNNRKDTSSLQDKLTTLKNIQELAKKRKALATKTENEFKRLTADIHNNLLLNLGENTLTTFEKSLNTKINDVDMPYILPLLAEILAGFNQAQKGALIKKFHDLTHKTENHVPSPKTTIPKVNASPQNNIAEIVDDDEDED